MVNINIRVDTPSTAGAAGDSENFAQMTINRKPLEESQSSAAALPEPGSEMSNLQRMAVCRLSNSVGRGSGLEQEKRVRREIANSNERRRMQSINAGFQSLRSLLPRKDGEKMSKASILQQTADLLKSLQAEKSSLSQQNLAYKQRLDLIGETPVAQAPSRVDASSQNPPVKSYAPIAPPKKRKFEFLTEWSDEGFGGMSDVEIGKMSSPRTETVQNLDKPSWEVELLKNELTKLRVALEQERRMRLLLEDQLRAVELSRIQTIGRLSAVGSLMEYSPAVMSTAVTSLPSTTVYSNSVEVKLASSPPSFTPAPMPLCSSQKDGFSLASGQPPAPANTASKQSLHAIVEAIRHLEGDQLFVEVDSTKDSGLFGRLEQRSSDSGISSPV